MYLAGSDLDMTDRKQILDSLISSSLSGRTLDEVSLGSLVKGAAAITAIGTALKAFKLPPPSKYSQRSSVIDFAKSLAHAKTSQESISAVVGLLNISARILLRIPELKDLGYKVMQVVQSERLEDFMSE